MVSKTDLVKQMAMSACISEKTAEVAYEALLAKIVDGVQEGNVQLTGFGVFFKHHYGPRQGRNPHTGESIDIPASDTLKFKVSKKIKEIL